MYKTLSLSSGGGIKEVIRVAKQIDSAVLCIGLGGTGIDCIRMIKEKVSERIEPDMQQWNTPGYSHIKFLAVDCDRHEFVQRNSTALPSGILDPGTEFCDLSTRSMQVYSSNQIDLMPEYREWLTLETVMNIGRLENAGGVRQVGRFKFFEHIPVFLNMVEHLIRNALYGLNNPKIYIYVFAGSGGGTGGGMLLDACYVIRNLLCRFMQRSYLIGYIFTPDVTIHRCADARIVDSLRANGYATLKELDHCMGFDSNGDEWRQYYSGIGEIRTKEAPFDLCHLVTDTDENRVLFTNAYENALNTVAEDVLANIVIIPQQIIPNDFLSDKHTIMRACSFNKTDANYSYTVMGNASVFCPEKECLTYVSGRMYENINALRENVPDRDDLLSFVRFGGLEYDRIKSELLTGIDMGGPFCFNTAEWREVKANPYLFENESHIFFENARATIEKNFYELGSALSENEICDVSNKTLITRIYSSFMSLAHDPKRGPFFAASLLQSNTGEDLFKVIDGYIDKAKFSISDLQLKIDSLNYERKKLMNDFLGSSIFKIRSIFEEYRSAEIDLSKHMIVLFATERLIDVLNRLKDQLVYFVDRFVSGFIRCLDDLSDTFNENLSRLMYIVDNPFSDNSNDIPFVRLHIIKPELDRIVAQTDVDSFVGGFLDMFLSPETTSAVSDHNEIKTSDAVNKFFVSAYYGKVYTALSDYLNYSSYLEDLVFMIDQRSKVLFPFSESFDPRNTFMYYSASLPTGNNAFGNCVGLLASRSNNNLTVTGSAFVDRATIYRKYCLVPLYAYADLMQYKTIADLSNGKGRYSYEGKTFSDGSGNIVTGRDWRTLPSPV